MNQILLGVREATVQAFEKRDRVFGVPEGEAHELQTGRPPLDLAIQIVDAPGHQRVCSTTRSQELGGLRLRESEVLEPDLVDQVLAPQRRHRQRWVASGRHHDAQGTRRMIQNKGHQVVDLRRTSIRW